MENNVSSSVAQLLDLQNLKELIEQLTLLTDVPMSLLDEYGTVIFASGTIDICTDFYRADTRTDQTCLCRVSSIPESSLQNGSHEVVCKNGIRTITLPIRHCEKNIAYIVIGHFFYDDEPIKDTKFIDHAVDTYGFDRDSFTKAFNAIPRCPKSTIENLTKYYKKLIDLLYEQSCTAHKLQEEHTLRTKAESDLGELNYFVKKLMTILPMPLFYKNTDGTYQDCNEAFEDLVGLPRTKIIGKTASEIAPPELAKTYLAKDKELSAGTGVQRYQSIVRSHQGREREIILTKTVINKQDGSKAGVLGAVTDVSDMKTAEKKAQFYKSYMEGIIDAMPSLIAGVNSKHKVSLWNKGAQNQSGTPPEEAVGQNFFQLIPELSKYKRAVDQVMSSGEQRSFRIAKYIDGLETYSDLLIFPLKKEKITGAVIQMTDVSERVKMEKLMVQAEKMMSMGNMSSGLAHELNNPLGVIIQGIDSLKRRISIDLPANLKAAEDLDFDLENLHLYLEKRGITKYIEGISEAGRRAAKIVHNVLNFSRRSQTSRSSHSINNILDKTLELVSNDYNLKKKFDFKRIQINKNYGNGLEHVIVSQTELTQVFLNLFKNAAQALQDKKFPEGEQAQISITTKKKHETAIIKIIDNGPGISRNRLNLIFDPFFTTKPVGEGVGLGLAVSYLIIAENHGGTLEVDSQEGKWTKFRITLPIQGSTQNIE